MKNGSVRITLKRSVSDSSRFSSALCSAFQISASAAPKSSHVGKRFAGSLAIAFMTILSSSGDRSGRCLLGLSAGVLTIW